MIKVVGVRRYQKTDEFAGRLQFQRIENAHIAITILIAIALENT